MTQFELAQLAKKISDLHFTPWHLRDPKLAKVKTYPGGPDAWYSYFINEWIPGQADASALMKLFIWVHFDPVAFINIIIAPPPGRKRNAA